METSPKLLCDSTGTGKGAFPSSVESDVVRSLPPSPFVARFIPPLKGKLFGRGESEGFKAVVEHEGDSFSTAHAARGRRWGKESKDRQTSSAGDK